MGSGSQSIARTLLGLTALIVVLPRGASAQEEELGRFFTGELSTVSTAGNSATLTLGLTSTFGYRWTRSTVTFEAGGVFSESSLKTRTAVGSSPTDFTLVEQETTETTAEAYFARGRYDYKLSELFFLFGSTDWLRNTFAGIDSRLLFAGGTGNTWADTEDLGFKTDYAVTYSTQDDVVENPATKDNFLGARFAYDFRWKLTASTEFQSKLIADLNLDNTEDVRLDFENALPISISESLAFKPALKLLWRNEPSLTIVDLVTPDGDPTGETVLVPLDKLDSFFTLALVVTL